MIEYMIPIGEGVMRDLGRGRNRILAGNNFGMMFGNRTLRIDKDNESEECLRFPLTLDRILNEQDSEHVLNTIRDTAFKDRGDLIFIGSWFLVGDIAKRVLLPNSSQLIGKDGGKIVYAEDSRGEELKNAVFDIGEYSEIDIFNAVANNDVIWELVEKGYTPIKGSIYRPYGREVRHPEAIGFRIEGKSQDKKKSLAPINMYFGDIIRTR
jgi:hypothetical protein